MSSPNHLSESNVENERVKASHSFAQILPNNIKQLVQAERTAQSIAVMKSAIFVVLFGSVVGMAAAAAADGFVFLWKSMNDLFHISKAAIGEEPIWLWIVFVPAVGGLVVGLFNRYINPDKPQGPPDVIAAAQLGHSRVPFKSGIATAFAAILSLGSGASVGGYGPIVHLGATIGVAFRRFAYSGGGHIANIGIGCGVAAAIAAAFNAPLAGMIFAHEVVLRHYSLRAFAPITVSATMGYVVTAIILDRPPLFQVEHIGHLDAWEYMSFVTIGVTGALVAVAFMKSILLSQRVAKRVPIHDVFKPVLAGFTIGLVALELPEVLGLGAPLLQDAMVPGSFGAAHMGMLLIAKLSMTALCLGFGFVGGVFSPSLVMGVLFGSLVGLVLQPIMPGASDSLGVFAICGMAAVTTAVIGAPISTILIILELTRNYELTTAVLLSVVFSNLVSYRIFGRSFFDHVLSNQGVDLSLGRDRLIVERATISDCISKDFIKTDLSEKQLALFERMVLAGSVNAQVVNDEHHYVGTVSLHQLMENYSASNTALVGDLEIEKQQTINEGSNLQEALDQISAAGHALPVLSQHSQELIGVAEHTQLVRSYRSTLAGIRQEENAA